MTRSRSRKTQKSPVETKPETDTVPSTSSPNPKQPGSRHSTIQPVKQILTRVWSKCDVIVVIQGMVDFIAEMGSDPLNNLDAFLHFINTNNNVSSKCRKYKFDDITWNLHKNDHCESNYALHLEARNCNVGNDNMVSSKDFNGSGVVGGEKKSSSEAGCSSVPNSYSGTNSSGSGCCRVGYSVGEKESILGKCGGGVTGCIVTKKAKRSRRSVAEKRLSLGKNDGGISCSSSVSSIGDEKPILGKYDDGVCCSSVINNVKVVKKSKVGEERSSWEKNQVQVSSSGSVSSVGDEKSILGEYDGAVGGSRASRRARRKISVGEKVNCIENVVGTSCLSSLENRENKSSVGGKKSKLKSKMDNDGETSKPKSMMDNGGKKCTINQANMSRRRKKEKNTVGEMTASIDNVGGVNRTGALETMGEKCAKTQNNINKKSGSACGKKSNTRVRVRRKTTIRMAGKKATRKNKDDDGKKQKKKISGGNISVPEAKKGGMKRNTDVKLTTFGFWDQTEVLSMKKSNVITEYGAGECTKTQNNPKNKTCKIAVQKSKSKSNIRSKSTAIIHVGKKAILKARQYGGTEQNIENNTCGKSPFREVKSQKKNISGFQNESNEVMLREALRRMISRRVSLRDELQIDISWCSPKIGVYKWNTDASLKSDDKMAAIGGVLRDWRGSFRCVFSCPVDCSDINEAEVRAIYKALELASCKDWLLSLNMIIESDSMNAVTWCNEDTGGPLNLGYMLSFIRECRLWWPGLEITYMCRKSNSVADRLAKQGHQRCSDFVTWM